MRLDVLEEQFIRDANKASLEIYNRATKGKPSMIPIRIQVVERLIEAFVIDLNIRALLHDPSLSLVLLYGTEALVEPEDELAYELKVIEGMSIFDLFRPIFDLLR